ncbi:hypothetical protein [Methylomonas sp. AM2-LC]|uniref:hypothetical protein n=1 Tax=Methylomonas sp. AM2-LC TaxID=3153301 RepID=UPI00326406C3
MSIGDVHVILKKRSPLPKDENTKDQSQSADSDVLNAEKITTPENVQHKVGQHKPNAQRKPVQEYSAIIQTAPATTGASWFFVFDRSEVVE